MEFFSKEAKMSHDSSDQEAREPLTGYKDAITEDSESISSSEIQSYSFSPKQGLRARFCRIALQAIPWIIAVSFACSTFYLLFIKPHSTASESVKWYPTDFGPARSEIELEQVTFTGGPAFDENGQMFVPNPAKIDYIGEPSPEIDEAWTILTEGRYIIVSEEEAKATWPDHWQEYYHPKRRGYVAGVDMFHTLHCLNNLRKSFHSDYYPDAKYETHKVHMNHCIDQIRQYVMCAGDMTPIPTKYYPGKDRNYVMSDVPHTCRNFEKLRQWQWDRFVGGKLEVLPDEEAKEMPHVQYS